MTRRIVVAAAVLAAAVALPSSPTRAEGRAAESAREVRPLLVGAKVPAAKVSAADGSAVDLAEFVSGRPTVLILYRGGW